MTVLNQRRATLMTMAVFAIQPLAFGAWLALLPQVQAGLDLSKSELAIALLGMPLALIPSLQIASRVIQRVGPRRLLAAGFVAQPLSLYLPVAAGSQWHLFWMLAIAGIVVACMQVSLNVYAGRLEKQTDATVMSRCHGFWALGLMVGSFLATLLVADKTTVLMMIAAPAAGLGVWVAVLLPKLAGEGAGIAAPPRRKLSQIPKALFALSLFATAISMAEGAMSDWAAIYLAERTGGVVQNAGIAVSIYAGFMAAGRLMGDAFKIRIGAVALARLTVGLAIAGLALLILPLPIWAAYLGFALVGLGASVGFPLGVSAAAALDDRYEGSNIAIMSAVAISGFLIGPPLIGFLSEQFSLRVGFCALLPGLIAGFWLAGALKPRTVAESRVDSA